MLRLLILFWSAIVLAGGATLPALAQQQGQGKGITATAARLTGTAKETRLIIDLEGAGADMPFRAFVLDSPRRVVVDLPDIAFAIAPGAYPEKAGLVADWRFGLVGGGRSRIVVDLAGPAKVLRSFVLPAADKEPARLILDVGSVSAGDFRQAVAADKTGARAALEPAQEAPAAPLDPASPGALPVVVIDPGHGGIDTGATSGEGVVEKDIVLTFARRLADKLSASGRYKAVMTRSDDSFVALGTRVDFARAQGAALFISIHADTLPDPHRVRGATIYTLSDTASDSEAASYAEKENRADIISGVDLSSEPDDVADILIDLTRRETRAFSNRFAKALVGNLHKAAALNKNPHRSAGFKVLKAPDVPSVLLELGYLSSRKDVALLTSEAWQDKASTAIASAVDAFFRRGTARPNAGSQ